MGRIYRPAHYLKVYGVIFLLDNMGSLVRVGKGNTSLIRLLARGSCHQVALAVALSVAIYDHMEAGANVARSWKISKSGACAGLCLILIPTSKRVDIMMTLLVRSIDCLVQDRLREMKQGNRVERLLYAHHSTALFVLSAWEIMFAWFYHPTSLPRTYRQWISRLANLDNDLLEVLRHFYNGRLQYDKITGYGLERTLEKYCMSHGLDPNYGDPSLGFQPCSNIVHPGLTCLKNTRARYVRGFSQALGLYIPVYFIPMLISRWLRPSDGSWRSSLLHVGASASRSAAFIATFIGTIWATICFSRNWTHNETLGPRLGSFLCGLSILLEKPERRHELALYCLPRALYSIAKRVTKALVTDEVLKARAFRFGEISFQGCLLASSLGVLVQNTIDRPADIRPSIAKLLKILYFDKGE